jgi:hypothetical protein
MENVTVNQKALFLSQLRSSWLEEVFILCTIVPMGLIGTGLNLISLSIFLKQPLRSIALFKYLTILSIVNSILAFSQIFFFLFTAHIFYDLTLSLFGRIFITIGVVDINFYFFFLGNLIEIMINIERALYFSEKFKKFKQISPFLICFFVLILSLIIFTPSFISLKMVPEDQIYKLNRISIPTDFTLSKIGKILLLLSYTLEGPVIFILLIATNVIAVYSFKKFNERKKLIERANNIEMMAEGEIKKQKKIEKTDRNLLTTTSYLNIISILAELIQFTFNYFYFIVPSLNPKLVGWMIFASIFMIALKQFSALFFYYNYKMFRKEFKSLIKNIFNF